MSLTSVARESRTIKGHMHGQSGMMSREGYREEAGLLERFTKRVIGALNWSTIIIEVLVALALVALAVAALFALGNEVLHIAGGGVALTTAEFNKVIGTVLEIFILVELFRIAVAYMRHVHVVPTVLEAALVAVARKFVVFEGGGDYLKSAVGLAALLLAVATSWWMLAHSGALEDHPE